MSQRKISETVVLLKILLDEIREQREVVKRQLYIKLIPYFNFNRFDDLLDLLIKAGCVSVYAGRVYYTP